MKDVEKMDNNIDKTDNLPSVDVIIPVYKPDSKLNHLIERLVKQSLKPNRIILLHTVEETNESSTAISYALSCSTKDCRIESFDIKKAEFDHGGTRNYGATLSRAELLLFMTQDAVPADAYLIQNLAAPFLNQQVAAAYARQLSHPNAGVIENYTRQFNYPEQSYLKSLQDLPSMGIKTYFCSNVCAIYRKSVYENLGGFVLKTIFNEDMIMAAQIINAGYSIAYEAQAKVYHSHVYTYIQQFKRNFDLAVSQQQYSHIFSKVKSEQEGIKLVKQTMRYLMDRNKYYLIPDLIFQSGFKYLGYKAGRNFKKIPQNLIIKFSMNPSYWNEQRMKN